jgi:hypothetical protein
MSEDKVVEDVKTPSVDQNENADVVAGNDKTEDYSVPGFRFRELNDKNKSLETKIREMESEKRAMAEKEAEEKQEYKKLYESAKEERDRYAVDAEKFMSIETARKERLLEDFPEGLRSKLEVLDSDALEQMKNEFNNKVPRVDESGGGVSSGKPLEWKKLSKDERKKHFADLMRGRN